jgi:D-alanyl-D-alanine carboxypeptidase/D-alanyl-D-alanine-endopeptidase (penicillin-binding protein 4)
LSQITSFFDNFVRQIEKMKIKIYFAIGIALVLLSNKIDSPKDAVLNQIKDLQNLLPGSTISFYVKENDKIVSEYNPDLVLATASTMKVLTTATALSVLGSNFRYQTHLEYDGGFSQSIISGNLYVRGSGDPTFGAKDYRQTLRDLVKLIKAAGVQEIRGDVVGDDTVFPRHVTPETWMWGDIGNYYGAAATGLCFNQNTYKIFFKPGKQGEIAQVIGTEPKIDLEFINDVRTGAPSSGDNTIIFGFHYNSTKYMNGTVPAGVSRFGVKGAMHDPALVLAKLLREELIASGIIVSGTYSNAHKLAKKSRKPLTEPILSEELAQIALETNFNSNNLYAEALFKTIALQIKGNAENETASKAIVDYWRAKGMNTRGMFVEDGSGLSRYNAVSAKQMVFVLTYMKNNRDFVNSLPVSAVSGTLSGLCRGKPCAGKISAKSGYIKRTRAYAGYVKTLSGRDLTFAIMVNNYDTSYRNMTYQFEKLFDKMIRL